MPPWVGRSLVYPSICPLLPPLCRCTCHPASLCTDTPWTMCSRMYTIRVCKCALLASGLEGKGLFPSLPGRGGILQKEEKGGDYLLYSPGEERE